MEALLTPEEYLRHLQEVVYDSRRVRIKLPSSVPDVSGMRDLMRADLGIDDWGENALGESLDASLREIRDQILPVIVGDKLASAADLTAVPIGGVVTRSPNALAVRVPVGGAVILFDGALGALLATLCLATVMTDILISDPHLRNHGGLGGRMPSQGDLAEAVQEAVLGFLHGEPHLPDLRPLSGDSGSTLFAALTLAYGEIRFVVAHEFGHVSLKHLDDNRLHPIHLSGPGRGRVTVDAFRESREQELDADKFGAAVVQGLAHEHDPPDFLKDFAKPYSLGPELFFLHLSLIERVSRAGVNEESTHPTAMRRLSAIRRSFRKAMSESQIKTINRCDVSVQRLTDVIEGRKSGTR